VYNTQATRRETYFF